MIGTIATILKLARKTFWPYGNCHVLPTNQEVHLYFVPRVSGQYDMMVSNLKTFMRHLVYFAGHIWFYLRDHAILLCAWRQRARIMSQKQPNDVYCFQFHCTLKKMSIALLTSLFDWIACNLSWKLLWESWLIIATVHSLLRHIAIVVWWLQSQVSTISTMHSQSVYCLVSNLWNGIDCLVCFCLEQKRVRLYLHTHALELFCLHRLSLLLLEWYYHWRQWRELVFLLVVLGTNEGLSLRFTQDRFCCECDICQQFVWW